MRCFLPLASEQKGKQSIKEGNLGKSGMDLTVPSVHIPSCRSWREDLRFGTFHLGLVHQGAKNGPPTCGAPGYVLKQRNVLQFQVDSVSGAMGMQPGNPF